MQHPHSAASLLSALESLLLGPDEDVPETMQPPQLQQLSQQQLLEQLVLVGRDAARLCLPCQRAFKLTTSQPHVPTTHQKQQACLQDAPHVAAQAIASRPSAYPLLLNSLQQGYAEAAQLLLLLLPSPNASFSSTTWPPMVVNRLAALATTATTAPTSRGGDATTNNANNTNVQGKSVVLKGKGASARHSLPHCPHP